MSVAPEQAPPPGPVSGYPPLEQATPDKIRQWGNAQGTDELAVKPTGRIARTVRDAYQAANG